MIFHTCVSLLEDKPWFCFQNVQASRTACHFCSCNLSEKWTGYVFLSDVQRWRSNLSTPMSLGCRWTPYPNQGQRFVETCLSIDQRKLGSNLPSYGQIELWDYTQWRVVCELTSHNNEKCETTLNEGWCVSWHHIAMRNVRLHSMKGGVWVDITSQWEVWDYTQWRVVFELTSHSNEKCETTLNEGWCVSWHHITMRNVRLHSMKGGVWVDIT